MTSSPFATKFWSSVYPCSSEQTWYQRLPRHQRLPRRSQYVNVMAQSSQSPPANIPRSPQCVLAVHRSLAMRPMHDLGDGRLVVPLLDPGADGIPFAVALELHRRGQPGRCTNPSTATGCSSFQLHYILQGSAELVQSGQQLGEVHAGDSVLMSSGTAQCQVSDNGGSEDSQSMWHLAALTLVLGVCPTLEATDAPGNPNLAAESVDVDCSAAQQVADGWFDAPVVGHIDHTAVAELVASAQASAQTAVSSQPLRSVVSAAESQDSISDMAFATPDSNQAGLSSVSSDSGSNHVNDANDNDDSSSGSRKLAGKFAAYSPGRLWQEGPAALNWMLQQMRKRQAVRHLESSLEQPTPPQVQKRRLRELQAFTLPGQSNRLALVFNPLDDIGVPFTFGLEIFERDHRTPPHVHHCAHELFFILSGTGTAFCDGHRFAVEAGDVVVFPPTSVHGIDNGSSDRLFCLELMLPNEMFAEMVRKGIFSGGLSEEDLCTLAAEECGYVKD